MKFRFHVWTVFLFLLLVAGPDHAEGATLTSGPDVDVATNGSAVVRWSTDVPTRGRMRWGIQPGDLRTRIDGPLTAAHQLRIQGLLEGRRYHYTIGTARQILATNSFVAGKPVPEVLPTPLLPPSVGPTNAPPTRETWGNMSTLNDHFDRHGRDFESRSPADYARQAWEFLQRAKREGLPMKQDSEGIIRAFDPKTRAFGAYNRNGTTRTFFRPETLDYFDRQPGRLVSDPSSLSP